MPDGIRRRAPIAPVRLPESATRAAVLAAKKTTPIPGDQVIEIAVHLRENPNLERFLARLEALPVKDRVYLGDANFDPRRSRGQNYYGASPSDVRVVEAWVAATNKTIADPTQRLQVQYPIAWDMHAVKIQAPAAQIERIFQIDLRQWMQDNGELVYGHTQDATIPAELAGVARGIIGFNTLGHFSPNFVRGRSGVHLRRSRLHRVAGVAARMLSAAKRHAAASGRPLYADEIASFYGLQPAKQVRTPRIAILEYGGRTSQRNLDTMGRRRGLEKKLIPRIRREYVGGIAQNFDVQANVECDLDAQSLSLGLASVGIRHELAEINALDTEMGAGDAVACAARDAGHPLGGAGADVISESWGDPRRNWTPYAIEYRRSANKLAAAKGVPVLVASGDHGSTDGTNEVTVDFFAGDSLNVGVGGTRIWRDADGTRHAIAWAGSGGGVDTAASIPAYQAGAAITPTAVDGRLGRGVPDVAAVASPGTGLVVLTGDKPGQAAREIPVGGTSLATPVWAMILAYAVALQGRRLGPLHAVLYGIYRDDQSRGQKLLRDITVGSNGDYHAAPGWDPVTGCGEAGDAFALAAALTTVAPANAPRGRDFHPRAVLRTLV